MDTLESFQFFRILGFSWLFHRTLWWHFLRLVGQVVTALHQCVQGTYQKQIKIPPILVVSPKQTFVEKNEKVFFINRDHILYHFSWYFYKFSASNIDGISHMVDKTKTRTERISWALVTFVSMRLCLILIFGTSNNVETSPTEFGIDEKARSSNDVIVKFIWPNSRFHSQPLHIVLMLMVKSSWNSRDLASYEKIHVIK